MSPLCLDLAVIRQLAVETVKDLPPIGVGMA
jgi:hypothetical protein